MAIKGEIQIQLYIKCSWYALGQCALEMFHSNNGVLQDVFLPGLTSQIRCAFVLDRLIFFSFRRILWDQKPMKMGSELWE